jgi:hypothetical protein
MANSQQGWRSTGGGGGGVGTVTSVGLSMSSAFSVANSPITTSGTLNVTVVGNATQYIRGDGTLATLPTSSGGGSSVSYYLNGSINQGVFGGDTYYQLSKTAIIGGGTNFNIATNGIIARFITDANDPDQLTIPNGAWNLQFYLSADSSGGTPLFYINLYKYDGATFTLISSGSAVPEIITGGTNIDLYYNSIAVPTTALLVTDRLAIEVYVMNDTKTITLHTEDSNLCQIITTFATGLTALNGLTDSVQYFAVGTSGTDFGISSVADIHTFNLPFADATNTGKLSSTDWSTFNSKQNTISLTTTGTSGASTLVGSTLNIPIYANTNIYNTNGTLTGARNVDLNGNNLTFNDLVGTGSFSTLIDDNAGSYGQLSVSVGQVLLETVSSSSGTGKYISVTPTSINIAGYYNLPVSASPSLNQIIYASSTSQLNFTSLKTINSNSIIGSGNISVGTVDTLTTTGTSGASTLVGSTLNIPNYTFTDTNIYNTNGSLTSNRTANVGNFNLIFSGLGTTAYTDFSRGNGGGTQSSFTLQYNNVNLSSFNTNDSASLSLQATQFFTTVSDSVSNSANIQQGSNSLYFYLSDSFGVINSLQITSLGISINSSYTIPIIDGTANQVLTTNGLGVVSFATPTATTNYGVLYSQATFTYLT